MQKILKFKIKTGVTFKTIYAYEGSYRNLMALLKDRFYIEDFGECGGLGRCATCSIICLNRPVSNDDFEGNELATLSKLGLDTRNVRLSCQILLDDTINGLEFELLENELFF
jgi:ferredoxin, 2Fe-2S